MHQRVVIARAATVIECGATAVREGRTSDAGAGDGPSPQPADEPGAERCARPQSLWRGVRRSSLIGMAMLTSRVASSAGLLLARDGHHAWARVFVLVRHSCSRRRIPTAVIFTVKNSCRRGNGRARERRALTERPAATCASRSSPFGRGWPGSVRRPGTTCASPTPPTCASQRSGLRVTPIYLGAMRPAMLRLGGELVDGALPLLFPPEHWLTVRPLLDEGRHRRAPGLGQPAWRTSPSDSRSARTRCTPWRCWGARSFPRCERWPPADGDGRHRRQRARDVSGPWTWTWLSRAPRRPS